MILKFRIFFFKFDHNFYLGILGKTFLPRQCLCFSSPPCIKISNWNLIFYFDHYRRKLNFEYHNLIWYFKKSLNFFTGNGVLPSVSDLHKTQQILKSGHHVALGGLASFLTFIGGFSYIIFKNNEIVFIPLLSTCGSACSGIWTLISLKYNLFNS